MELLIRNDHSKGLKLFHIVSEGKTLCGRSIRNWNSELRRYHNFFPYPLCASCYRSLIRSKG